MIGGPVSAEVAATDHDGMVAEGERLAGIAKNVVVKLPLTLPGLKACRHFAGQGIRTNVTLCFSANQALLAAKAGATYVSPFLGRLDDINLDGMALIRDIRTIYDNYGLRDEDSCRVGPHTEPRERRPRSPAPDVATMPPAVIRALASHPLTETGLAQFVRGLARDRPVNPVRWQPGAKTSRAASRAAAAPAPQYTTTDRMLSPACIKSNPLLMSPRLSVWVIIGSISILPSMYHSTIRGTSVRPRAPPKAVPFQVRPVTSWNGRVAISAPRRRYPDDDGHPPAPMGAFERVRASP